MFTINLEDGREAPSKASNIKNVKNLKEVLSWELYVGYGLDTHNPDPQISISTVDT